MARRLIDRQKKLRGINRRLRAIRGWADRIDGRFPAEEDVAPEYRYWNLKIPVALNLVEGRQTTDHIRRVCAQSLIDACARLARAKPDYAAHSRVTCVVCMPDMYASEVCLYLDEDYFLSHTRPSQASDGAARLIEGRRLSQEWGLVLPEGFGELGLSVEFHDEADDSRLVAERWYFGDVGAER